MKWVRIKNGGKTQRTPKKYDLVLIAKAGTRTEAPSIIVGYRNSHGVFITPGGSNGEMLYWNDCLGPNFTAPGWMGKP